MNRRLRGAIAGVATIAVALGIASAAAATTAGVRAESAPGALAEAAQCAYDGKTVLVDIVVDASGSLKHTDPNNVRVAGVKSVLGSLETLASDSGGSVEVSLSTFGDGYNQLVGWGPISDKKQRALLASAASAKLPLANDDLYTNYGDALDGARDSLDARAADVESGDVCKVMVWFTDGQLDVDNDPKNSARRGQRARQIVCCPTAQWMGYATTASRSALSLCSPTKLVRRTRTYSTRSLRVRLADQECGTPGLANGDYLKADDVGALNYAFATVGSAIEGLVPGDDLKCNADGDCTFPVDAGVFVARIQVDRALGDGWMTLVSPDGKALRLEAGEAQNLSGTRVQTESLTGLTTIELTLSGDTQKDTVWTLQTGDGGVKAKPFYGWGAHLSPDAPSGFEEGKTTQFKYELQTDDLKVIDPGLYKAFKVTVGGAPDGVDVAVDQATQTVSVGVPENLTATNFELELQAVAVTKTSRYALGPIAKAVPITVVPPGSPNVATGSLNFGVLGDGSAGGKATLVFTGAEGGPTKACFGDVTIDAAPDSAGEISIHRAGGERIGSDAACVDLPQNDPSVEVPLELLTENSADGKVSGSIAVKLQTVDGHDLPADVTFRATMVRPVNLWLLAATLVALIVLAIAIAWLTALIGRHFADRFRFGPGAQYAAVDVLVTASGLSRTDGRSGDLFDPAEDFHRVSSIGNSATTKSMDIAGLQYRRKAPVQPVERSARCRVRSWAHRRVGSARRDGVAGRVAGAGAVPRNHGLRAQCRPWRHHSGAESRRASSWLSTRRTA